MRRLLELNLGEEGFTTHAAADAETGLKLLSQEKIDLVVTDFKLPGMNGLEFLQAIKRVDASLPVVIMTAYGSVESAVEAMKVGGNGVGDTQGAGRMQTARRESLASRSPRPAIRIRECGGSG